MERVLLWVSLCASVLVYLVHFLPLAKRDGRASVGMLPEPLHPGLRLAALVTPFVGLLVTLPTHGAFFSEGQRLGLGFLIGGIAALLAQRVMIFSPRTLRVDTRSATQLTASYATGILSVVLVLLFLRQSLLDGLMGVALGNFAVSIALYVALPEGTRSGTVGRHLVASVGFAVTLAAAVGLAVFRDPLTPELAKLTWSSLVVTFATLGTLLVAGTGLLPLTTMGRYGRLLPLTILVVLGGVGLYQLSAKLADTHTLTILGIGGLLAWPVSLAVLRESTRRGGRDANGLLAVPLLSVLVVTSGFLVALQTLQGTGVAVAVVALYLAYPATFALVPTPDTTDEEEKIVPVASVGLLLFATLLLLWRFFVTRWTGELRGVNLSDQYALFGLIVGAALPGLLANLPIPFRGGARASNVVALAITGAVCLAAPAAVLVLFGAKSVAALLIGLALGAVPVRAGRAGLSLLPGLCAVAVALALDQWTGTVLPEEAPTRVEKMRYLIGLVATIIVLALVSAQLHADRADESERGDPA